MFVTGKFLFCDHCNSLHEEVYRHLKHDVIANFHGTFFALNIVSNRTVELLLSAAGTDNFYAV